MVNISKKLLSKKTSEQIHQQLIELFALAHGKRNTSFLLDEILSDSEKVMLAKRLAIIAMLHEQCSSYEINQALQVSTATIKRIRLDYESGAYATVRTIFSDKRKRAQCIANIEAILRAGMPPRGRGRWSRTFKMIDERNSS